MKQVRIGREQIYYIDLSKVYTYKEDRVWHGFSSQFWLIFALRVCIDAEINGFVFVSHGRAS